MRTLLIATLVSLASFCTLVSTLSSGTSCCTMLSFSSAVCRMARPGLFISDKMVVIILQGGRVGVRPSLTRPEDQEV